MTEARLSRRGIAALDARFKNNAEAHELLALIAAEFRSDPLSVQCFDARIVTRVHLCVAKEQEWSIG